MAAPPRVMPNLAAEQEQHHLSYIYQGGEQQQRPIIDLPLTATHISVDASTKVISARAFFRHPHIIELICHNGVELIEEEAFAACPRLRRVVLLGVTIIKDYAFYDSKALIYVECPKLEQIGASAFRYCSKLSCIDLPSVKGVDREAFNGCRVLRYVKFGYHLERLSSTVFARCRSLERVTIPLKRGIITADDIFIGCANLKHMDLVEGELLEDIVAALQMEEWRKDMEQEINAIGQVLPNAHVGDIYTRDEGGKARAIREWTARVLNKLVCYKEEHYNLLKEAALILFCVLPNDIVTNKVISFLELQSQHAVLFEGGNEERMGTTR